MSPEEWAGVESGAVSPLRRKNAARRGHGSATADQGEPEAAAFVLAGGRSSRMGRDKASLSFAGQPLVVRALTILREAGLTASIAGPGPQGGMHTGPQFARFAPVIEDAESGLGPLAGICAALSSTSAGYAVFVPVDLPLLPASLVGFLLHHAGVTGRAVTVPVVNGSARSFPVVLKRTVLPVLQEELAARRLGCFAALQAAATALGEPVSTVAVELLVQCGQADHPSGLPAVRWFLNVNTPADLELASRLACTHRASAIA